MLKWQEKVLPSAKTFHDALYQARAAEQQEKQLLSLHCSGSVTKLNSNLKPMASARTQKTTVTFQRETRLAKPDTAPRKSQVPGLCYECHQPGHHWCECPESKPPSETLGKVRASQQATSLAVSVAHSHETLEDRCQRLRQEWVDADMVNIAGKPIKAMVDTGSSVTILSWDVFQAIGREAQVPASAVYKPEVTLRDYSQRPILVGAMVDLEVKLLNIDKLFRASDSGA